MPIKEERLTIADYKQTDEYKQTSKLIWEKVQNGETADLSGIYEPCAYMYYSELQKLYSRFQKEKITKEQAAEQEKKLYERFLENYERHLDALENISSYQANMKNISEKYDKLIKAKSADEVLHLSLEITGALINKPELCESIMKNLKK